jgi:pSer/pThr/pTyr-binding forkhead associated (FHA) protein
MGNAKLLFDSGPGKGISIPLSSTSVTIGRKPPADFLIEEDFAISSLHCRLSIEGDGWIVVDLNSSNGTIVNGHRISRHRLVEGDLIQAGNSRWIYRSLLSKEQIPDHSAVKQGPRSVDETPRQPVEPPGTSSTADSPGEEVYSIPWMRLHVLNGSQQGKVCWISLGQSMTIGRRITADYVFPDDPMIAGNHCRIVLNRDACLLEDLQSSNGTWCNGIRVEQRELRNNDRLKIGQTDFLIELPGDPLEIPDPSTVRVADVPSPPRPRNLRSICVTQTELSPGLFRLTGSTPADRSPQDDVAGILEQLQTLAIPWYAVVDPGKIDLGIEDEDLWSEGILFPWLPEPASTQMPILVGHQDFHWRPVVEEGWNSDGLVILISPMDRDELLAKIQGEIAANDRLSTIPDRILGICWPSVLLSHLTVNVDGHADRFLEGLVAVMIEDAAHPECWHLIGNQQALQLIKRIGLKVADPNEATKKKETIDPGKKN